MQKNPSTNHQIRNRKNFHDLSEAKTKYFPPKYRNKAKMSTLTISGQHCTRDSIQCNKAAKPYN